MDGYLIDTNIIAYWFDERSEQHGSVITRAASLAPNAPLFVSWITIGEIDYGHRVESQSLTSQQAEFVEFVDKELPQRLSLTRHTTAYYGDIRARLFNKYAPEKKRTKGMRPEQLLDPETAKSLGIQENDVWIAAQAIERNLVLVTHDRMDHIRQVTKDAELRLRIEDWARPTA